MLDDTAIHSQEQPLLAGSALGERVLADQRVDKNMLWQSTDFLAVDRIQQLVSVQENRC